MSMFDTEDSGFDAGTSAERAPLRARLVAEADVVRIAPPPTLAVREAGARRTRRRRALQAGSGVLVACAVAGAVVAWVPGRGPATAGNGVVPTHPTSASPAQPSRQPWPTDYEPDLPGYLHRTDLGDDWVGPYAIPEGNISPTLATFLACGTHVGQPEPPQPLKKAVFRSYNDADPRYGQLLVEGVYEFAPGKAADTMQVLRETMSHGCEAPGVIVPDANPAGDDMVVFGWGPNKDPAQTASWLIFIRSGDKIAYVSTGVSQPSAPSAAGRLAVEQKAAARLKP